MSVILSRTISSVVDKRIVLSNSQFARLLPMTWNSIRIGVRWHMRNNGANLGSGGRLAVGVCAGTTNLFGDATTDHFVGWVTDGTWAFFTPPNQYTTLSAKPATRIGSTLTLGTVFAAGNNMPADAGGSNTDRKIFFLDIVKGSPNFSLSLFAWSSGAIDVTDNQFLLAMEQAAPSLTNHAAVSAQTIAVNEGTNGTLNAVNISWGRSTPEVEVCSLAIARFA